jgi:hypothetical protein
MSKERSARLLSIEKRGRARSQFRFRVENAYNANGNYDPQETWMRTGTRLSFTQLMDAQNISEYD